MNSVIVVCKVIEKMAKIFSYSLNRSYLVDFLAALYGTGSWIAMTGLWMELPVLTPKLPEGWSLASYLSVSLQFANIACVIYGIGWKYYPNVVNEVTGTHAQMMIGTLSCLFLIPFWSKTVMEHSVALYVLSFGLSIVDCASSVVFLPYMARFPSMHMTPYLIGEGISGFLPSLVAIAQGVKEPECKNITLREGNVTVNRVVPFVPDPRFAPEVFFAILLCMVLVSWIAFCLLQYLPTCKRNMILHNSTCHSSSTKRTTTESTLNMRYFGDCRTDLDTAVEENTPTVLLPRTLYLYLLFMQGWAALATFGIFPAIQPYSSLPYGNQEYHLTVTLSGLAYPLACTLGMFIEVRSIHGITILTIASTMIACYILGVAIMSPVPPLVGTLTGSVIIVAAWTLFTGMFSYIKTMVTVILTELGSEALFWCGAVTQIGATLGAITMFVLVNFLNVFKDEEDCTLQLS